MIETPQDYVKSFAYTVLELKDNPSETKHKDVERALAILNEVSDLESLSRGEWLNSCLLDLQWLLESQDYKSSLVWSSVSFLTRLCRLCPSSVIILRDKFEMVLTLTDLLCSIPSTTHNRTAKLLELMKYVVYGIRVRRIESFINKLVTRLMKFIMDEDKELIPSSLFILTSLCRNNYNVTQAILGLLTKEEINYFFVKNHNDSKLQVVTLYLNYCMNIGNVTRMFIVEEVEECLTRVSDAFCSAYADEDILMMKLITDFIRTLVKEINSSILFDKLNQLPKQIVVVAEFVKDCNMRANECMFSLFRETFKCHSNLERELEFVVKLLILFLDLEFASYRSSEAILLLYDVVSAISTSEVPHDTMKEMECYVESVVVSLYDAVVFTLTKRSENCRESILTIRAVFKTLLQIAKVNYAWSEIVSSRFKNELGTFVSQVMTRSSCLSPALVDLVLLCYELKEDSWKEHKDEISTNLFTCLKRSCHPDSTNDTLMILGKIGARKNDDDAEEEVVGDALTKNEEYPKIPRKYEDKIESAVFSMKKAMETSKIDDSFYLDVFELGNFRLYSKDRKNRLLQKSLEEAEKSIERLKHLNVCMETENMKLSTNIEKMMERDYSRKMELDRLKSQFQEIENNARNYKKELSEALTKKTEEFQELEKDHEKLTTKALTYKDDIESLQTTIQEHHKVQEELQEKLKSEKKIIAEMSIALEKREEKLRKKERQLDEEMTQKQKLEKELESVKKEFASYQTVTKRQLDKKEKQLAEQNEELQSMKQIQDQIFNLSRLRNHKGAASGS